MRLIRVLLIEVIHVDSIKKSVSGFNEKGKDLHQLNEHCYSIV